MKTKGIRAEIVFLSLASATKQRLEVFLCNQISDFSYSELWRNLLSFTFIQERPGLLRNFI